MDAAKMEIRLRAFYAKHNPGNNQNIAEIVRRFSGREPQLCAKLCQKYGEAPDLTSAGDTSDEATTGSVVSVTGATYQRDFKPFALPIATASPLDVRSGQFDAGRALAARKEQLELPVTTVFPLDNIQKCRYLLPESDSNRQTLHVKRKKSRPLTAANVREVAPVKKTGGPAVPSLFEQLADTYMDGPFRVLRRCFFERRKVFVVLRRVNSVRGTCCGFLKAFDKHMNLVLLDVTQEFLPHCTHEKVLRQVQKGTRTASDAVFSAASGRRNRRVFAGAGGTQREYVKQLFIRGDNVVSVSAD
uniref:Sm domain-containing protein n=1 Tax=Peronospora matthiolae TaxID=2874970 RepID=A0AAV1TPP4_9STRA